MVSVKRSDILDDSNSAVTYLSTYRTSYLRMKSMLMHSFVLDALDTTGADTFTHFEILIDEHRRMEEAESSDGRPSRLKQLVPTVGTFHTHLPLRRAFWPTMKSID